MKIPGDGKAGVGCFAVYEQLFTRTPKAKNQPVGWFQK
jgi:hypothetical protein